MKNYLFLIILCCVILALFIWNIVYIEQIHSMCGPPYYYCAYELRKTLPMLGYIQLGIFMAQEIAFIVYFVMYKRDLNA